MDALASEVEDQPGSLIAFARSRFPRAPKGSILVGAGDSYAAALAGFYASEGRCIALDPYSLVSAPGVAKGVEVYFISASGRTASNLAAARKVRGVARKTTALTAVPESELARSVDRTVALPMRYVPKTSGMLSFSLSLLAVLRISGEVGSADFHKVFADAQKDRGSLTHGRGTTYFLGNSTSYSAALYAAAKTYELLGERAHAELLEEFSHLEVFSLASEDAVNVFSCFDPSKMAGKLAKVLGRAGHTTNIIPCRGASVVERLFHSVFTVQLALLDAAAAAGLREPSFLRAGRRLQASDELIY